MMFKFLTLLAFLSVPAAAHAQAAAEPKVPASPRVVVPIDPKMVAPAKPVVPARPIVPAEKAAPLKQHLQPARPDLPTRQATQVPTTLEAIKPGGPIAGRSFVYILTAPNAGALTALEFTADQGALCGDANSGIIGSGRHSITTTTRNQSEQHCWTLWQNYVGRLARAQVSRLDRHKVVIRTQAGSPIAQQDWERFLRQPHGLTLTEGGRTRTYNFQAVDWAITDEDGDGAHALWAQGTDCDDKDPNRFPGNLEIADFDGVDDDCNPNTIGTLDMDRDGFTDWRVHNTGGLAGEDCNDQDRGVHPNMGEIPGNGKDDNCDGDQL